MNSGVQISAPQAAICGYRLVRALAEGQSYLAIGPDERQVTLKRVDEDCLLGSQLHPSVKERLGRVRELAHAAVANLHGVCREGPAAWLIWEFVEGQPFDEWIADNSRKLRERLNGARELVLAVDSLHRQGIVHGALVGTNIIVTREGAPRLIHVSPLLYTDAEVDVDCVVALLQDAAQRWGEPGLALGRLLDNSEAMTRSLTALATGIAALLEVRSDASAPNLAEEERHIRRKTILAAGIVGLLGLVLAYGIWRETAGSVESGPARWMTPNSTPGK